jgi:hypothetical protein
MGRQHQKKRRMTIRQTQKRQAKLSKLRQKYDKASASSKKDQIIEQVLKIAPGLSKEKFLKPLKNKEK